MFAGLFGFAPVELGLGCAALAVNILPPPAKVSPLASLCLPSHPEAIPLRISFN